MTENREEVMLKIPVTRVVEEQAALYVTASKDKYEEFKESQDLEELLTHSVVEDSRSVNVISEVNTLDSSRSIQDLYWKEGYR